MKYSVNWEYFALNTSDGIDSNIIYYVKYIYVNQNNLLLIK
jgi:hypothetical protein